MTKEEIIDFEQLWDSGTKCRRSVTWKPVTKSFILNQFERTLKMEQKLKEGTWKNGKPRKIEILYPKKREGLSIPFRDRVYQRSINDNALYPMTTRSFIYDNAACQSGKGPGFARDRLKHHLHNFVMKHGLDGWVLQYDIHGYYPSMSHKKTEEMFSQYVSPEIREMVMDVLDDQYSGETGYNPGSQMVQIAGITMLGRIDHICKEELHMENFQRYMDDGIDIDADKERAERNLDRIKRELASLGFTTNPKKTHVIPLREGFSFLGWYFRPLESRKIIVTIDPKNVKHERQKLRRMAKKAKRGEMTKKKCDQCYASWRSYATGERKKNRGKYYSKPNTYKLIKRVDEYYDSLWKEDKDEDRKNTDADTRDQGT